jgi:hypothetical protein
MLVLFVPVCMYAQRRKPLSLGLTHFDLRPEHFEQVIWANDVD